MIPPFDSTHQTIKQASNGMLICILGLLLSACASPLSTFHGKGEGYDVYAASASTRYAFIRSGAQTKSICSEPAPDVATDENGDISLSLALINSKDRNKDKLGIDEVSLGGRSVNVLLTREIFFRTCEFLANNSLTDEQALALFNNTLNTIVTINKLDFGRGSINAATLPVPSTTSSQ